MSCAWILAGVGSHLFWWAMLMTRDQDDSSGMIVPGIVLCVLSLMPATLLGPLTFFLEWFLYWLTSDDDVPKAKT